MTLVAGMGRSYRCPWLPGSCVPFDAGASRAAFPRGSVGTMTSERTLERPGMHSHAGAWERLQRRQCPIDRLLAIIDEELVGPAEMPVAEEAPVGRQRRR